MGALAADLAKHTSLQTLGLWKFPIDTAEAMAVLVDAAISLRLRSLSLRNCQFSPATLPEVTRLIKAGWLNSLEIGFLTLPQLFGDDEPSRLFCEVFLTSGLTGEYWLMYVGSSNLAVVRGAVLFVNCRRKVEEWVPVWAKSRGIDLPAYPTNSEMLQAIRASA